MTDHLKTIIKHPLTDDDIERYLGNEVDNILKYSELENYHDLEELLPTDKSYKILLIEYEKNTGHWICLLRYDDTIEMFNSYGVKPSKKDFVKSKQINKYLGQYNLFLNDLLNKETKEKEFDVVYNKVEFQEKSKNVNTCGRHVLNRIICMLYYDMSLKDYIQFMKKTSKQTGHNYDEIVSLIIT